MYQELVRQLKLATVRILVALEKEKTLALDWFLAA